MGNTSGRILKLTTFGESHGKAMGGVLDGFPVGFTINLQEVEQFISLRRPGQSAWVSPRKESDTLHILSGIDSQGKTLGSPLAFIVHNQDTKPSDYHTYPDAPLRPSHADYTYSVKYRGALQTGGGRSSARETLSRCVAGAIAMQYLRSLHVEIFAFVQQLGHITLPQDYSLLDLSGTYDYPTRCPDPTTHSLMVKLLESCIRNKDSVGGVVRCVIRGVSAGWGSPVYDKLSASLAQAMMSINAAKGFEIGDGFALASMYGSQANDPMSMGEDGRVKFLSNHSGGIQGGISNGEDIFFNVAFKPTPSISQPQTTITQSLKNSSIEIHGRHDPSVVIRAVPVVQAMAALTLLDAYLLSKTEQPTIMIARESAP